MQLKIFTFLFVGVLLVMAPMVHAFTLSGNNVDIGVPIIITGANPDYLYSIFGINNTNPHEDACAYIYGWELTGYFATDLDGIAQWVEGDNDLTHYGTCFVNDPGTFKVVELSDQGFAANFTDSRQSDRFVSFDTLVVR